MSRRLAGLAILVVGIGFILLSTAGDWMRLGQPLLSGEPRPALTLADALPHLSSTGLEALAAAGLLALLFSRTVPRWWSLAYAVLALGLLVAIISWGADIAVAFVQRMRIDPDSAPFAAGVPRPAHYIVIGGRLVLGVVATFAIAAPLLLPPRLARRPPDVPKQPLGL